MMPYIAILIDSFWETVGNRILWALLIGWSIILAGLAPFGYVTERSYRLASGDINNFDQLKDKLIQGSAGQGSNSIKAVVATLDPSFINSLKKPVDGSARGRRRIRSIDMARELNRAVESPSLYSAEAFPTAEKRQRLKPLIDQGAESLTVADREQLNRELLQIAFPYELNQPRVERLWIGYGGFKLGEPLNVSRRQIKQFIEPLLLGLIIKLGLGVVAVFVSLIVTSPIVPETFKSGSLHLLLSKPISRVWLYLFKFFGGCVFVLFNITFLLVGLYFIAGIRFDIWNEGLIGCIPLLLFVFIVFYSVSALAGVIWGNAIVCVVSCIVFWMFCFALGAVHDGMLRHVDILPQISRIEEIDDKLLAVNQRGEVGIWNEKFSVWQPAVDTDSSGEARTFGPIYDAQRNQILVKSFFRMPFGNLVARSRKVAVIRIGEASDAAGTDPQDASTDAPDFQAQVEGSLPPDGSTVPDSATSEIGKGELVSVESPAAVEDQKLSDRGNSEGENLMSDAAFRGVEGESNTDPKNLAEARETPYWMADTGPEIPAQLIEMTQVGGETIAICRGGLFRLNWEKDVGKAPTGSLFGMLRNFIPGSNAFENIAPKDFVLSDNSSAATTADGQGLIIYTSGDLHLLRLKGERLEVAHTTKLEGEGTEPALVLANNSYSVVARDSLPISVLDAELKTLRSDIRLPNNANIRQIAWIPSTNFVAILTHLGDWWKLDCSSGLVTPLPSPEGKLITTMTWRTADEVWLGIQPNRVVDFNISSRTIIKEYSPVASTLEYVFNWIVKPLYIVNPKPTALDNAMSYILSGSETQSLNLVTNDMEQAQVKVDVWSPIISNLAFVAVMLAIGSVYVARKEF
jgi:hypothetical protein